MLKVIHQENDANGHGPAGVGGSLLDELARDGARLMLAEALQAEVAAYVEAHAELVDEDGRRLVVRNGYHQAREVSTAAGADEHTEAGEAGLVLLGDLDHWLHPGLRLVGASSALPVPSR